MLNLHIYVYGFEESGRNESEMNNLQDTLF